MRRRSSTKVLLAATAICAIGLPGPSSLAQDKPDGAKPKSVTAPAAVDPAKAPSRGKGEGIKVHGHWTIRVLNSDGTVAVEKEYENALTGGGAEVISRVFARQIQVDSWCVILLYGHQSKLLCERFGSSTTGGGLTVSYVPSPSPQTNPPTPPSCVITGFTQFGSDFGSQTDIAEVRTVQPLVDFSETPVSVKVLPNQIVQVTVTYTFS